MGKNTQLGMNPVERHRKKMHEREVKKNKETKKQMREVAVLYKDTTKLEDKIERYRGIKRKLTEEENGRLRGFEAELDEARKRQREAGVEINREHGIEGRAVGYDPLSGDKEHNAIVEYDSSSDNEVIDEEVLGKEVALDQDEYEKEESNDICLPEQGEETLDSDKLPPMPAGTPPLLPEDMCCDNVWPVLPGGPSPQYELHHLTADGQRTDSGERGDRGRGRWRGRGRGHGGGRGVVHPHPYMPRPTHPPPVAGGQFPPHMPAAPPFAGSTPYPAAMRPPPPSRPHRPQPAAASGTVLAAEPQVRDLKKELTTLVPSAIARKNKQKDRQRVLESVPMAPQMIINAAPDVGAEQAEPAGRSEQKTVTSASMDIIGSIKPTAGVSFSTTTPDMPTNQSRPHTRKTDGNNPDSLDDQYQKFMSQMDKLI